MKRRAVCFLVAFVLLTSVAIFAAPFAPADDQPTGVVIHVRPRNQPLNPTEQPTPPRQKPPRKEKLSKPEPIREPPPLPPSVIPRETPERPPQEGAPSAPSDLAAQIVAHKIGTGPTYELLKAMNGDLDHHGAYYDGANIRVGNGAISPGAQTNFFHGSPNASSEPVPVPNYNFAKISPEESRGIIGNYGSQPGGVVLEGAADPGRLQSVTYDSRFNALVVDDRAAYFLKIPPRLLVELCRALFQSDLIGVSLGKVHISYGALPKTSRLARHLMLTDNFLGSIAFAQGTWTKGYVFAQGYTPQPLQSHVRAAVFFRFSGFQFREEQREFKVTQENFDDRFVPLSRQEAANGGSLPDDAAVLAGAIPPEVEANLRHLAENMSYYRREKLTEQTFALGATAAFLRGLRGRGVDLWDLADAMEDELGDLSGER